VVACPHLAPDASVGVHNGFRQNDPPDGHCSTSVGGHRSSGWDRFCRHGGRFGAPLRGARHRRIILVLLASLAVLVPLQRRIIATPSAQAEDIEAMRLRWFSGNLGRSLLSVASFVLLVVATIV
jgi:hypothetical protein